MLFRIADLFPKYCLSHSVIFFFSEKREVLVKVGFSRGGTSWGGKENLEATATLLIVWITIFVWSPCVDLIFWLWDISKLRLWLFLPVLVKVIQMIEKIGRYSNLTCLRVSESACWVFCGDTTSVVFYPAQSLHNMFYWKSLQLTDDYKLESTLHRVERGMPILCLW